MNTGYLQLGLADTPVKSFATGKLDYDRVVFLVNVSCRRLFACNVHRCSKPCHSQDAEPTSCPSSPSLVTHCPCGKRPLDSVAAPFFPPGTKLSRTACTDPIPTCESTCMKPHDGCTHSCNTKCHIGPCPPCSFVLVRPCRCGGTTREVRCFEDQAQTIAGAHGTPGNEILCDKPCGALRNCGSHQCGRVCCPLASLAGIKGKGRKKAVTIAEVVDQSGWHECDRVCGKVLRCGNHTCEERDHPGLCPPCLRSSFEEVGHLFCSSFTVSS